MKIKKGGVLLLLGVTSSTVLLSGCFDKKPEGEVKTVTQESNVATKKATLGDFNTVLDSYTSQARKEFVEWSTKQLNLMKQDSVSKGNASFSIKIPNLLTGNISIDAEAKQEPADENVDLLYSFNVKLDGADKISDDMSFLKDMEKSSLDVGLKANIIVKDKKLYFKLNTPKLKAEGNPEIKESFDMSKKAFLQGVKPMLKRWIEVDGDKDEKSEGITEILKESSGVGMFKKAKSMMDIMTKTIDFSFIEKADEQETEYNGMPAYKITVNQEKAYQYLESNIKLVMKTLLEMENPLMIKGEKDEDILKNITVENIKKHLSIDKTEGYLVQNGDKYEIIFTNLELTVKGDSERENAKITIDAKKENTKLSTNIKIEVDQYDFIEDKEATDKKIKKASEKNMVERNYKDYLPEGTYQKKEPKVITVSFSVDEAEKGKYSLDGIVNLDRYTINYKGNYQYGESEKSVTSSMKTEIGLDIKPEEKKKTDKEVMPSMFDTGVIEKILNGATLTISQDGSVSQEDVEITKPEKSSKLSKVMKKVSASQADNLGMMGFPM